MLASAPPPTNVSQGFHLRTLEYMHVQVFDYCEEKMLTHVL